MIHSRLPTKGAATALRVLLVAGAVWLMCIITGIVLSDGYVWSSRHILFERVLCALPYPSTTEGPCGSLSGAPESCWLYGLYSADIDGAELANFYRTELAIAGWDVVEDSQLDTIMVDHRYYDITLILFERAERHFAFATHYWLVVEIASPTSAETQLRSGDTIVSLHLSDNRECVQTLMLDD